MAAGTKQAHRSRSPSVAEAMRAHGVILEDIRSQMAIVVESVTSTRTELKADIAALEARLDQRITVLEQVVRELSDDIRSLREEVARLRHDFDHREERGRVGALEMRVSAIEALLGISSR